MILFCCVTQIKNTKTGVIGAGHDTVPDISHSNYEVVGITRAHMADPHIVRKIMEGREHDIRPCIGATYCLDRIYQADDALCIHNPATGRELSLRHVVLPAPRSRRAVIFGSGPAGLEAALVAAERGHEVTIFQAAPDPGGQVRQTATSPIKNTPIVKLV